MGKAITLEFPSFVPAPEHVDLQMPDSMHPSDRQFLITELGKITTEVAKLDERGTGKFDNLEHRLRAVDARLAKLELRADASGAHDISLLQKALEKERAKGDVWQGRLWAILATFITTGALALIAHYIATR